MNSRIMYNLFLIIFFFSGVGTIHSAASTQFSKENKPGSLSEKIDRCINQLILDTNSQDVSVAKKEIIGLGTPAVLPLIKLFNNVNSGGRYYAVELLGALKDSRSIKPFIAALKDDEEPIRIASILALNSFGEPAAESLFMALPSLLPDWNIIKLNRFFFKEYPQQEFNILDEKRKVYIKIYYKDMNYLEANWIAVKKILLDDIRSGSRKKIEFAVFSFIAIGKKEVLDDLKSVLSLSNNKYLAETFLNCGNPDLQDAARLWAKSRGYSIGSGAGHHDAAWGSW